MTDDIEKENKDKPRKIVIESNGEDMQIVLMRKIAILVQSLDKANGQIKQANGEVQKANEQIQKANDAVNSWMECSRHNQTVAQKHKKRADKAEAALAEALQRLKEKS